jgi:DNA mismatch repair protein MutL
MLRRKHIASSVLSLLEQCKLSDQAIIDFLADAAVDTMLSKSQADYWCQQWQTQLDSTPTLLQQIKVPEANET